MHSRFAMVNDFSKTAPIKSKKGKMYLATSRNGDNDKKPMRETLTY